MPRARVLSTIFVLIAVLSAPCYSEVYLSPSGSDSEDCLTPATACFSLYRAYEVAAIVDNVVLDAGEFNYTMQQSFGGLDKRVTFSGANSSATIVRGLVDSVPMIYVFNSSGAAFMTTFANMTIVSTGADSSTIEVMNATTTVIDSVLTSLQGSAFRQLAPSSGVYSTVLSRLSITTAAPIEIQCSLNGVGSGIFDSVVTGVEGGDTALMVIRPVRTPYGYSVSRVTFRDNYGFETGGLKFAPVPQGPAASPTGASTTHFILSVTDCIFSNISGAVYGALLLADSPNEASIVNTVFRDCSALYGSAIFAFKARRFILQSCVFERNVATEVGTVYRGNPWDDTQAPTGGLFPSLSVATSRFINNTVGAGGGALYVPFGGIYFPLIATISDSNFTSNVAVGTASASFPQSIGGAIVLTGPYAASSIQRCRFVGNGVTSPYLKDSTVAGGAIYMTSFYSSFTISDSVFDSNFAATSKRTASAGAIGYVCFQLAHTLSLTRNVFSNNYASGLYFNLTRTSTGGGAISFLQFPNAALPPDILGQVDVVITGSLFENNTAVVVPSESGRDNAQGGAIFFAAADPSPVPQVVLTVTGTNFTSNRADAAGGIIVLSTKAVVDSCVFQRNWGEEIAGAFAALDRSASDLETEVAISNTRFDGNFLTPNDPLELSYTDIFSQNTLKMTVANCSFVNNIWDPTIPFSSSLGTVNGMITFLPASTEQPGAPVRLPAVFAGAGGRFNVSQVSASFDSLTLWYRVGSSAIDDARSGLVIGLFPATVLSQFVVNNGSVESLGGELHLRGRTDIVTKGPNVLSDVVVKNFATVRHYESQTLMINSTIRNEPNGTWNVVNFNPEISLVNADSNYVSAFVNEGKLTLSTALLDGVQFRQTGAGSTRFIVSNYWTPSTLKVQRASNQGDAVLDGAFALDFSLLEQYSEPSPFQEFLILALPTGFITGNFTYLQIGGYTFSVRVVSNSGVDQIYARVAGFYPRRAVYSNTGTTVIVTFPRPTNTPGAGRCSAILSSVTLSLLDASTARCIWKSPSELLITSSRLPGVGSSISFAPDVVYDSINSAFAVTSTSVSVMFPQSPQAPSAVIVAPDQLAQCDSLVLDGSASYGGGTLPLEYLWNLNSTAVADAPLKTLLQSTRNSTVVIPASIFASISAATSYQFSLQVTSSFGAASEVATHALVRFPDSRPKVFVEGLSTRLHPTSEALKLQGRVSFASCLSVAEQLSTEWSQVAGPVPRRSSITSLINSSTLFYPEGSFEPGATYVFRFSASVQALSSSATVTVRAVGAPMTLLSVGDGGYVPSTLNATLKVELVDPSAGSGAVSYTWLALRCPVRGQANTGTGTGEDAPEIAYSAREIGPATLFDAQSLRELLLTRPTGVICPDIFNNSLELSPSVNSTNPWELIVPATRMFQGDYLVAVLAQKDSRVAQALLSFSVVSSTYLRDVKVELRPRLVSGSKILPDQRLAISGFLDGVGDIPPSSLEVQFTERDLANATISSSVRTRTFTGSLNQVVEAGSLAPGRFYFLELQAVSRATQIVVGSNRVVLPVNSAPTGGSLVVSPRTGGVQFQEFSFSAPNWNDDADQPLRYVFSVSSDLNTTNVESELVLSDGLEVPSIKALLPLAGDPSAGSQLRVTLRVYDALGAETTLSTTVEAFEGTMSVSTQFARLQQNLLQGDISSSIPSIMSILVALNKVPSSDTSNIRDQLSTLLARYALTEPLSEPNLRILFSGIRLVVASPSSFTATVRDNVVLILQTTLPAGNFSESARRTLVAVESTSSSKTVSSLLLSIRDLILASGNSTAPLTLEQALSLLDIARRLSILQSETTVVGEQGSSVNVGLIQISSVLTNLGQLAGGYRFSLGEDGNLLVVQSTGTGFTTVSTILWQNNTFPITRTVSSSLVVGSTTVTITLSSSAAQNFTLSANFSGNSLIGPLGASQTPTGCGVYDPVTQVWVSNGCNLQSSSDPMGKPVYTCTCPNILSTTPGSGNSPSTRSLTLLFDISSTPTAQSVPSAPSAGSSQGDLDNRTAAIIAGSVVAGVIVLAIIIGLVLYKTVFLKKQKNKRVQMERLRQSQSRGRAGQETPMTPRLN